MTPAVTPAGRPGPGGGWAPGRAGPGPRSGERPGKPPPLPLRGHDRDRGLQRWAPAALRRRSDEPCSEGGGPCWSLTLGGRGSGRPMAGRCGCGRAGGRGVGGAWRGVCGARLGAWKSGPGPGAEVSALEVLSQTGVFTMLGGFLWQERVTLYVCVFIPARARAHTPHGWGLGRCPERHLPGRVLQAHRPLLRDWEARSPPLAPPGSLARLLLKLLGVDLRQAWAGPGQRGRRRSPTPSGRVSREGCGEAEGAAVGQERQRPERKLARASGISGPRSQKQWRLRERDNEEKRGSSRQVRRAPSLGKREH